MRELERVASAYFVFPHDGNIQSSLLASEPHDDRKHDPVDPLLGPLVGGAVFAFREVHIRDVEGDAADVVDHCALSAICCNTFICPS